jgi:hypothetical protein
VSGKSPEEHPLESLTLRQIGQGRVARATSVGEDLLTAAERGERGGGCNARAGVRIIHARVHTGKYGGNYKKFHFEAVLCRPNSFKNNQNKNNFQLLESSVY